MALVDNVVSSDIRTRALKEDDALAVKALIGEQAAYASYYPAMLPNFVPGPSVVSPDNSDQAAGAVLGLYDWNFKKLILSHAVTALTEMAQAQQAAMLQQSFTHAVSRGAQVVTAHLDIAEDRELAQTIERIAAQNNMTAHVAFNDIGNRREPEEIIEPDKRQFMRAVKANSDAVVYRHPTVDDAFRVWSLVNYMNREMGGLDVYDISNYERLFRDSPETSVVTEYEGEIGAFSACTATSILDDKKGLNMWQTGSILPGAGFGCEKVVIAELKPDFLSFTVTPGNGSANTTAQKKVNYFSEVKELTMEWENPRAIETDVLGNNHDPEVIYTIAPPELMNRINRHFTA